MYVIACRINTKRYLNVQEQIQTNKKERLHVSLNALYKPLQIRVPLKVFANGRFVPTLQVRVPLEVTFLPLEAKRVPLTQATFASTRSTYLSDDPPIRSVAFAIECVVPNFTSARPTSSDAPSISSVTCAIKCGVRQH